MKKEIVFFVVLLFVVVIAVTIMTMSTSIKKSHKNNGESSEMNFVDEEFETAEDKIKEYNQSFGSNIGTDFDERDGNAVKAFINKVIEENNKANNDDKILLHFESWKGNADSNGDETSTQRVYNCIGDANSTYKLVVDEYTEEGKIKKVSIIWVSGTGYTRRPIQS